MIVEKLTSKQREALERRFWSRVDRNRGDDGPWLWAAGRNRRDRFGYGKIFVNGRHELAHRVAWELINGPIPEGMRVLHRFDDPLNVNPRHLFLGTQRDNVHDMVAKKRCAPKRGEQSGRAILTETLVREIRRLGSAGLGKRRVARLLGTTIGSTECVLNGTTWKHVI